MRIAVVTELLVPPYDEGFKKTASQLIDALKKSHEVIAIRAGNADNPLEERSGFAWCWAAGRRLRRERPDWIVYIPASSVSFFSLVRARLLAWVSGIHALGVIGLQRRTYAGWQRGVLPWVKPAIVFVQTTAEKDDLTAQGFSSHVLPSGIDLDTFRPVDGTQKSKLRQQYELPQSEILVLHVGHLKPGRNLETLIQVQADPRYNVVIATSASTVRDQPLREQLDRAGVRILDTFLPRIEEVYQACDVYFFPVLDGGSAIGFPLSVLEAMACGLPVVSTPYGALPSAADVSNAIIFWNGKVSPIPQLEEALSQEHQIRDAVLAYSWEGIARQIEERMTALTPSSIETTA